MKAVLSLLMSVAIAVGGVLPGRALYDCAMTGKRGQPACCCKAFSAACSSCARCEPGAGTTVTRDPTGPDHEATLRAACCSVTYEKSALRHAAPAGVEGAWKVSVRNAHLAAALRQVTAAPPGEFSGRAPRGLAPSMIAGAGGAPLFILHCSLTL